MGPLERAKGKENMVFGTDQVGPDKALPSDTSLEPAYADCIFRDGYVPKDDWDRGWTNMLEEKPWETNRIYREYKPNSLADWVIIGIFMGCREEFKPEFMERAKTLSPKFTYLLSQFGHHCFHRASFTVLEWIPHHHLRKTMETSVDPKLREIFDRHFGKKHHSGDDLKEKMAAAVQEVVQIAKDCLSVEKLKDDFRGLLFHAGLQDISEIDACVTYMAKSNLEEFQAIVDNSLNDLSEIKAKLKKWNDDNCPNEIKA